MDLNDQLTREEKQQLINEGIFDWFKRSREGYKQATADPAKAGGVAGAVGTGLGTGYKYLRKGAKSVGGMISKSGEKKPVNPNLAAAVTAGVTRASTGNKVGSPIGYYSNPTPGTARISGTQKFIPIKQSQFAKSLQNKKPATGAPSWRPSKPSGGSNQTGFASLVK